MSFLMIILLLGIVVFITNTLQAITGFGNAVLAFPFFIVLLGNIEQAKIILSIIAWFLALWIVITQFKNIHWKQFGIIILLAGLGMPFGIVLFKTIDANILKKILGTFIVVSAIIKLKRIFFPESRIKTVPGFSYYNFLFLGGIVHGAFAVGGPFIVIYATRKLTDKGQFQVTLSLLWAVLNSVLIIQYFLEDQLTQKAGIDLMVLMPFLIAGTILGEIIHRKVDENIFRKIVFSLLLAAGVVMLIV